MSSACQRIFGLIRDLGVSTTLLFLSDLLLRRISRNSGFSYYRFFAQALADQPRLPPRRGAGLKFQILEKSDVVPDELNRSPSVAKSRFAQGAQCLITKKDNVAVGCIWFISVAYTEDEVGVDYVLPTDGSCVWDFDVFIAESERHGFLFAKQWDAFDAFLKPQGICFTLSRINAFNLRSLASHRRLGARDFGWALFLRLGSFQWMLCSQRPFIHFGPQPQIHFRSPAPR
jgi:hypothetical protein